MRLSLSLHFNVTPKETNSTEIDVKRNILILFVIILNNVIRFVLLFITVLNK